MSPSWVAPTLLSLLIGPNEVNVTWPENGAKLFPGRRIKRIDIGKTTERLAALSLPEFYSAKGTRSEKPKLHYRS